MTLPEAIQLLVDALSEHRPHAARWRPSPHSPFLRAQTGSAATVAPEYLLDDGNLLFAVFSVPEAEREIVQGCRARASAIAKMAHLLSIACLDAGMHRMVVVLVVPQSPAQMATLEASFRDGELRTIVMPAPQPDWRTAADDLIRALRPLGLKNDEDSEFLRPIDELDDFRRVESALGPATTDGTRAVLDDVAGFLEHDGWTTSDDWPQTRRWINRLIPFPENSADE